ncbi:MAG: tyrosine-protein phosphatase [Pigmentiphaga sp.]|nr:tyrosine-protein phosphatase [Pigmentiphaga sp.]
MKQIKSFFIRKTTIVFCGVMLHLLVAGIYDVKAINADFTSYEKTICYSLNMSDSTITFLFDLPTWQTNIGSINISDVVIRGSFNLWKSSSDFTMSYNAEGFWYLTKKIKDIKQPGNSGQPEFKFYVNGSTYMSGTRSFVPEGYIFKNSDKNHIVIFPDDDFELIKTNSLIANKIKSITDYDLTNETGKADVSNFRQVPGGTKLFRSYHPFKASKATICNTEDERLQLGIELATAAGIQSDICLSGNEITTLTSYTMPDGSKLVESIPPYYQMIIDNDNILYVGQTSTTPSYSAVYYQSNSTLFGNWIKEIVQFIISDFHPAPFSIHCRLGTDRTGVFCAVLEALQGVPWDAIAADYQLSNNMGIQEFRDFHLLKYSLENMLGVHDISTVTNLQTYTSNYFINSGYLTRDEINRLNSKLGTSSSYSTESMPLMPTIHPNPAKDYISIILTNDHIYYVSILQLDGRVMLQTTWNNEPISISCLNSGIYLVKIEDGKNTYMTKLMVK